MKQMMIVTTPDVAGKRIAKTLGLRGNTIRARHIGKDIMAVLRHMVGGEIHEYAKLLAESREQALDRLVKETEELGGNAVVNVRITTSVVMNGAAEMLAYGTAVILEDSGNDTEMPDAYCLQLPHE